MTYQTPELLLVGAAQNLVLGELKNGVLPNIDQPGELYTDLPGPPDSFSW